MGNEAANVHDRKCSECEGPLASVGGKPYRHRQIVCSRECGRVRKTRLQKERREAAYVDRAALRPARSSLVFLWAYHIVHETLRRMQEGVRSLTADLRLGIDPLKFTGEDIETLVALLGELKAGKPSACALFKNAVEEDCAVRTIAALVSGRDSIAEPEVLRRLLCANQRTVRFLVNKSRWLRGVGNGRGNLLGSFLWEHPGFFVTIKSSPRFRTHHNHSNELTEFVARTIAAAIAGYAPSAGDGHLARHIERCSTCKSPALIDRVVCLHREAKRGERYCWQCGACTHPDAQPGDRVCPRCGVELIRERPAPHSRAHCRDSTTRCLTHDVVLPDRESFRWCGIC